MQPDFDQEKLSEVLELAPALHLDADGEPTSWAIGRDVLEYLGNTVGKNSVTMETGAGMTTVIFALLGCRHRSIAPSEYEFERIREFCSDHSISLARTEFVVKRSEDVLPHLPHDPHLDLFLIDGRHAFPSPYIDWYYGAALLKVGGLVVVDDTQIETGAVLRDFMTEDHHWQIDRVFDKTAVFRLLNAGFHTVEWNQQPYITNRMPE